MDDVIGVLSILLLFLGMFILGVLKGAGYIQEEWEEKMIDRGYIEYQICPETGAKILVDKETGEVLDLTKE